MPTWGLQARSGRQIQGQDGNLYSGDTELAIELSTTTSTKRRPLKANGGSLDGQQRSTPDDGTGRASPQFDCHVLDSDLTVKVGISNRTFRIVNGQFKAVKATLKLSDQRSGF